MTHIKPGSRVLHLDPDTGDLFGESWVEVQADGGVTWERLVIAAVWRETERTDCYCCSCPDYGASDPYCRNHGGHHGLRPCELHGMPGREAEGGGMPVSVQAARY